MLREYESLQSKIHRNVEDLHRIETIIPLAIAAIYAWSFKDGVGLSSDAPWIYVIPPLLSVIGLLKQRSRNLYIGLAENYIRRIEDDIYGCGVDRSNGICGWENFYAIDRDKGHRTLRVFFWYALMISTGAFAAYMIMK